MCKDVGTVDRFRSSGIEKEILLRLPFAEGGERQGSVIIIPNDLALIVSIKGVTIVSVIVVVLVPEKSSSLDDT